MPLYLGTEKVKINLDGVEYLLNISSVVPIISNILLQSYDDFILQDSNGLYITVKEDDE